MSIVFAFAFAVVVSERGGRLCFQRPKQDFDAIPDFKPDFKPDFAHKVSFFLRHAGGFLTSLFTSLNGSERELRGKWGVRASLTPDAGA